MATITGLDRIGAGDPELLKLLQGRDVGLLAHPASVDRHLRHAREVLEAQGVRLRALFGPEHGYGGEAQDMIAVDDEQSDIPVYSLYGSTLEALTPQPEWLSPLDVLVIDLQDVGSRYYTYVWTAVIAMEAALAAGVEVLVLDRPNPLGGDLVEGAPQAEGYGSFVGWDAVAVRHGMTIGEIVRWGATRRGLDTSGLHIATMRGWLRSMTFEQTGLPWVLPSPNMPTLDTALVYPGGCLLEGTNLSEGRGTTRPFEIWGAPYVEHEAVMPRLRAVAPDEVALRPMSFEPTFQKHGKQRCFGVQVHRLPGQAFASYYAYAAYIAAVAATCEGFAFRTHAYEFVDDIPAIDLLTGDASFRETVEAGAALGPWVERQRAGAQRFDEARRSHFLYGEG